MDVRRRGVKTIFCEINNFEKIVLRKALPKVGGGDIRWFGGVCPGVSGGCPGVLGWLQSSKKL